MYNLILENNWHIANLVGTVFLVVAEQLGSSVASTANEREVNAAKTLLLNEVCIKIICRIYHKLNILYSFINPLKIRNKPDILLAHVVF